MRFSELDRFRNRYPQLSSYIAAAEDYLQELLARPKPVEIVPSLVAQRLSVDEELVLSVLLLFDEAGIIEPRYQVRCSDSDGVLLEFKTLREIPERLYCPYHGRDHDRSDYYVELVFIFRPSTIERYSKALSGR